MIERNMNKGNAKEMAAKRKRSGNLIPGFEHRPNRLKPASDLQDMRWQKPLGYIRFVLEDAARRVEESRALFPRKFFRGDCHAHSQHSDGIGTVAEMADMAKAAGLDFQFDYTDAAAIALWDDLLASCRRVHAMGNTDAHSPHGIGTVWNGVFAPRCDEAAIARALAAGRCFVSEAPLLDLAVGTTGMGRRVGRRSAGAPLRIVAADARGLMRVRLVGDGKVLRTWHPDGKPVVNLTLPLPAVLRTYVRAEAVSMDGKRGYTNPVYLALPHRHSWPIPR